MNIKQEFTIGRLRVYISIDNLQHNANEPNKYYTASSFFNHKAYIKIEESKITVCNDVCGLFRVYYWCDNNNIYLTNNIYNVLSQEQIDKLDILDGEWNYFQHHGYTSGELTYFKEIKKVGPYTTLCIDEQGVHVVDNDPQLFNQQQTPNKYKFKEVIRNHIIENLSPLISYEGETVLCFSGGTDSQYLAETMKQMGLKFSLAYFLSDKSESTRKGLMQAEKGALRLGLKLNVFMVDDRDDETESAIKERMIFDSHVAYLHFYGTKQIVERWGKNVVIVNGQNSDAILSFGPSERKPTSFIKRYLLYGHSYVCRAFFAKIIGVAFRQKLAVPINDKEFAIAFYANFKNCVLLNRTNNTEMQYVSSLIDQLMDRASINPKRGRLMQLKVQSYIQGSDSQVVIQSVNYCSVKVVMPFAADNIIRDTLRYKNDMMELFRPKYTLR